MQGKTEKAGTLTREIESERLFLSEHADQCFRALTRIIGQITDEDMREIATIKAKRAYIQADHYGFESVSSDERETWKDSLDMIDHIISLMDYYTDMSTMFPLDR